MKTRISSKGQIVLPAELRARDRIEPGQHFEVERIDTGEYLLRRCLPDARPGLVRWLRTCPDPDWFRPLPSESTADL